MDAAAQNQDAFLILETSIKHYLDLYDADPLLEPLRLTLKLNRQQDPNTTVWWSTLADCETATGCTKGLGARDDSVSLARGSLWLTHVLRVKMSEYICLL